MLNISNVLLSYADRGLSQVSSQPIARTNAVTNEPIAITEQPNISISY